MAAHLGKESCICPLPPLAFTKMNLTLSGLWHLVGPAWAEIHLKSRQPEQCDFTLGVSDHNILGLSVPLLWKSLAGCLSSEAEAF